jgi:intracellular sulfur oxidation DsrE/DsrF family protein
MKNLISAVILAILFAFAGTPQIPSNPKHHVVFQLSEPQGQAWDDLMVHVNNLLANLVLEGGVQVEVVFLGPGVNMLRKTNVAYEPRFKHLLDYGVTFAACQNSMGAMKLKTEDLFPFATQVRAGIAEIVHKQEAGWSYIH